MKNAIKIILITLLAIPFGCSKSAEPVASFTISNSNPSIDEFVTFTSTSTYAHHVKWTFSDGTTATSKTVSKSFDASGIYSVKLQAYSETESSSDAHTEDISVCKPGYAVFYIDSANYKRPINIEFNGAFEGTLNNYTQGTPLCGTLGTVTAEICPGTYTYIATDENNKVWQNKVKITANNCVAVKLSY